MYVLGFSTVPKTVYALSVLKGFQQLVLGYKMTNDETVAKRQPDEPSNLQPRALTEVSLPIDFPNASASRP